ncbi:isopenicillin N synthase family oxygenase [Rhodoferax sp. BLA1]|uniref:isopenicillin N synthase family dioxygenase n=1 Tax=Rhodoferax sp. BLA1 TaxID=2576062 RepID=UPI0015D102F8|nr:isopenicillin N synthase family oxygenase [Rhodoferax sp. BLA1]
MSTAVSPVRGDFSSLPLVNVRGLFSADVDERQAVARAIGEAARTVGFFYITGHGIAAQEIAALRTAAADFYARDLDWKMRYYIGLGRGHKGFVPEGEEVYSAGKPDHKEAYDIGFEAADDHPMVLAGLPLIGGNKWPELPGFKTAVQTYYAAVFDLGLHLLRAFALALGQEENAFDAYVTCPPSKLRLIHYPVDSSAEDTPGIGAHTDYECFTLLLADQPGLEVLNNRGQWIDAPPLTIDGEEAYVINVGDMLEVMTAGAFVATSHRVRKVKHERYSFPLFFACDYGTRIRPLPQFARADASPLYEELSIGEHMWSMAMQTYRYLGEKRRLGELQLPDGARQPSSFGNFLKEGANTDHPTQTV